MATANTSAARRFLDRSRGLGWEAEIAQLTRALDLAEAHDARAVPPVTTEKPLHERALASVRAYEHRLPPAAVELQVEAMVRLAALEHERNSPPRPGIQVKVADDLDVMSLEELCRRYNTQRATINSMVDENRALTEKARRLDAIRAALDV